tara:strand:+ start:250 stop:480 length:231 start_codon:yes stop_codon:yes gene_type:complete
LETLFPDISKEADGWDPSMLFDGTEAKMSWECQEGHLCNAKVCHRTSGGHSCPTCAEYGFNPGKTAWLYLMSRNGE